MKQFSRDPRLWLLLTSPFVTAIFSFLILKGTSNITADSEDERRLLTFVNGLMFTVWMLIGFCVCSGIFVLAPVSDREFKLRYLINFMGMRSYSYFIGNFLTDIILFMVPTIGFIFLLFPMKIEVFSDNWGTIFFLMSTFGVALITLSYVVSFLF